MVSSPARLNLLRWRFSFVAVYWHANPKLTTENDLEEPAARERTGRR